MRFVSQARCGIALAVLTAALAGPAFAATDEEITAALVGAMEQNGASNVKFDGPARNGDTLTYSNLSFRQAKDPANAAAGSSEITLESLDLTGADIPEPGAFDADSFEARGMQLVDGDTTVTVAAAQSTGISIDAPQPDAARSDRYDTLSVDDVSVMRDGREMVGVARLSIENDDFVEAYPRKFVMRVDDVVFDPSVAPNGAEAMTQLRSLGYEKLTFDFALDGTWDDTEETARVAPLKITGTDIGTLELSLTLAGVSREVLDEMQKPEPSFEQLTGLAISDLRLRFDDSSVTNRILSAQAAEMGTDAASLAGQLAAALPLLLSPLQNPPFQTKVATAAGAFLQDPKSITVTAQPPEPVSFMEVFGTSQAAPETLPDLLNADITANQ